ncbi:hypothetical protein [Vibrio cholerae]|uniref:hypothetical protein n=1 Tax=Vibrio cholerae TaxID=666 RepID=UPI000BA944B6|nr:hypothetical protein [Vibrio cholerae]PAS35380.1 hypothetical protein CGT70_17390 [Vibrio cholerae]
MSRYSKKCLVSNDDLLGFFGKKYDALLKQASFLSLIGGNVPEVLNSKSDAFYICVDSSGVELRFDRQTSELTTIVVTKPAFYEGALNLLTKRIQVRNALGTPSNERPEKSIPVLGRVGAMDEYIDERGFSTQIVYKVGTDYVERVHYQRK